jgi:nucleoid DNA-binding protein
MTAGIAERLQRFLLDLRRELERSGRVQTALGEFIARRQEPIAGRNPRTGEPIHVAGRFFFYLLPSDLLVARVFGLVEPELSEQGARNREVELSRMEARFGIAADGVATLLEVPGEIVEHLVAVLAAERSIRLEAGVLFSGELVAHDNVPALTFGAVGALDA